MHAEHFQGQPIQSGRGAFGIDFEAVTSSGGSSARSSARGIEQRFEMSPRKIAVADRACQRIDNGISYGHFAALVDRRDDVAPPLQFHAPINTSLMLSRIFATSTLNAYSAIKPSRAGRGANTASKNGRGRRAPRLPPRSVRVQWGCVPFVTF